MAVVKAIAEPAQLWFHGLTEDQTKYGKCLLNHKVESH